MEWLPEWAAKDYTRLYYRFRDRRFDFSAAQDLLGYEKAETARTLQEIVNSGFLYRGRLSTDLRKRVYHLIPPEQFALAFALSQNLHGLEDKLRVAGKDFEYVVTGAAAAYKYHGYMASAKTDILIHKKDLGFWIALLKGEDVQISIDDVLAEKPGHIIHLHTNLTEETFARARQIDRIYYTSPEDLILESFRRPDDTALLDAIAIMLVRSQELDWNLFAKSDVSQEIGFTLQVLNLEAGKEVFSEGRIKKFAEREGVHKRFSIASELLELAAEYYALAKGWNLEVNIPPRVFRKAVEDLVG